MIRSGPAAFAVYPLISSFPCWSFLLSKSCFMFWVHVWTMRLSAAAADGGAAEGGALALSCAALPVLADCSAIFLALETSGGLAGCAALLLSLETSGGLAELGTETAWLEVGSRDSPSWAADCDTADGDAAEGEAPARV